MKMRVVNDTESYCKECGTKYGYTREMYQIQLFGEINYICFDCVDKLFRKTLSANVKYNAKVKTKEDMKRIMQSKKTKEEQDG